ncbi:MAG: 23S rRNA (uracil(1939)-C(5))-methyltransferase RlmD [Candidatus Fimenecus sp.]
MAIQKNDEIQLHIEALSAEGSGVGHFDGMAVFVAGGVPGDTLLVHIIKAKKTYAVGKIVNILTPSEARIAADCPLFPQCGGCAYRFMTYKTELREKQCRVEDAFARLAHMPLVCETILSDASERYRNKAQYPVTRENGKVKIGFYAPRSHRVIDCTDCRLQPAEFAEIVAAFRTFLTEFDISAYDAQSGKGLVRHLYLRKGFHSGEIMVCVVLNGTRLPHSDALVDRLCALPYKITSIVLNTNTQKTNVILGTPCKTLWGTPDIGDTLCGVDVRLSPLSFYQVNHNMAEKLYLKAAEFADLKGDETVLDLYCGAGTIGLSMAQSAKQIYGAEIVPEAIENAKENAKRNHIDNTEFFCGDAADAAKRFREMGIKPDVVLLDPPRKGCDASVLQTVAEMHPKKIVYVSCDPATLARDAERLFSFGYTPTRLAAADLFPRTVHVESVCLFLKEK